MPAASGNHVSLGGLAGRGVTAPPFHDEKKMKESTDRLIRRVAILAILVVVAFTCYRVLGMRERLRGLPRSTYRVGEKIDIPVDQIVPARSTVVVFARSTCGACQANRPFAARLAKDVVGIRPHAAMQIIAVQGMTESELRFADEMGVSRNNVRSYNKLSETKIRVVPTTLVVDPLDGKILYAHEGVLNDHDLSQIGRVLDVVQATDVRQHR